MLYINLRFMIYNKVLSHLIIYMGQIMILIPLCLIFISPYLHPWYYLLNFYLYIYVFRLNYYPNTYTFYHLYYIHFMVLYLP